MTQLTEARTAGSFGNLTGLVASGGVLVLSGAASGSMRDFATLAS